MGLAVGYMGTKRHLAPSVAEVVRTCRPGPVLDSFSGMCAVGEAIGESRSVWHNDVQRFSFEVAQAFFGAQTPPPLTGFVATHLYEDFEANKAALTTRFDVELNDENISIDDGSVEAMLNRMSAARHVGNDTNYETERDILSKSKNNFPYRLCSITFSDGYFGLKQSIEIDSIRYCIDKAIIRKSINHETHRWLLIALCQAALRVASTTGHFAQFIKPNLNNLSVFLRQRKRSVWETWLNCIAELNPIGGTLWRRTNKAFNQDSLSLLEILKESKTRPAVIYADPPYTDDQYSRYYHIWETLVIYDYPKTSGHGRYRPDRFNTPFSKKTTVKKAMDDFIGKCRALKSDLVLSYPENGLLCKTGENIIKILKHHYDKVEISHCLDYNHSTMGASKGVATQAVKELIYLARTH